VNTLPPLFRKRFRQHNRQCLLSAVGALLMAWLGWVFFYGFCVALVLLLETVRIGESAEWPRWLNPAAGAAALVLLVAAAIRQRWHRFQPAQDRPVIGLHVLWQVLLLPAIWTLSVADYLDARLKLSDYELHESLRLLQLIRDLEKPSLPALGYYVGDAKRLARLLTALQTIGWIDLHRGEDEWYYRPIGLRLEEIDGFFTSDEEPAPE